MNIGSGQNGEWTFLDIISLVSFFVGLQNLDMNITQEDVQATADKILKEIHSHLEMQDKKIDKILEVLHENNSDVSRKD